MAARIVGLVAVFLLALAGTLFYLSRSPDGARRGGPEIGLSELAAVAGSEVRLGEEDLRRLVRSALEDHPNGRRALDLSKELRAGIGAGRVEVGLVINLAEIPPEKLEPDERETVAKVRDTLPFLADQDLYLAVSGVPAVRDGRLTVDEDLRVKLAFLTLPIDEMAALFGFDPAPLRERLFLDPSPFRAREVEVLEGVLVVRLARG